ncbi:LysR family transcriptional regulator [Pectobacterium carotovorum]|uniref:LysR family transcriptional regulator n=1 Tax=Pectobacterium carotovorum TaxID=554 RepID=UPI0029D6530B|nr:LysR family transcriptional regulator [Pectobacterium carotovorum]MDX6914957.1 LysR family transcriptional regulator [Pectobacterium carotovorum]
MELNRIGDIAAFVAAVDSGSYTRAAGSVGLSRSAIGKSITRLESQLGVRLLNRTTRQLSLTEEGRIMYERCKQILEDLEDVDATMALRREKPTGTLRLTAPLSLGQRHILPIIDRFLKQWPELRADIVFTDRYVDLIEEGFDIAIRIGEPRDDSRILTRTIATQHMVTCASPEYLARRGTPTTPETLNQHDTIFFRSAEKRRNWRYMTPTGDFIYDGPGRMDIDSSEAMLSSAISGFGIIQLPDYLAFRALEAGDLVAVLTEFRVEPEPVRIIYPSKRHLSPRIRGFVDLIAEDWQNNGVPWKR